MLTKSNSEFFVTVSENNITYTNFSPNTQDVVIKTSAGQNLTVNAPNANITHYGDVNEVNIIAVANSSYTGKANISSTLTVSQGNFLRMYQRSAWIMTLVKPKINAVTNYNKQLKTRIVSVGFPFDRLESWIPENFELKKVSDNCYQFIPSEVFTSDAMNLEESVKVYSDWFDSKFVAEKKKKHDDSSFSDIWLKILSYPIERKSPIDCMSFIEEIKTEIAKRITSEDV